ncbi:UNVERIFIED_CONTAM: hypothetical protein GTU68_046437 [Idotea baltica]|nr:hypothetical protein [Idotea baltica]
MVWFLKLEIL